MITAADLESIRTRLRSFFHSMIVIEFVVSALLIVTLTEFRAEGTAARATEGSA